MDRLSDELLIKSYNEAKRLHLSGDFLCLIEEELNKRNLLPEIVQSSQYTTM